MRTSIILKVTFVTTLGSSTWIATAQQVEDQWWIPNSTVHAVARDTATGTIYLGGEFTSVAAPVRFGAALDPTTAAPEVFWAMPNGAVYESIPDGAGGWYICGAFTQVGSSPRVGVARLNSDGSVHPFVCDITGQVLELAQSNDTLYLGGTFTSNVLTSQRNYMAVNANTGAMFPMFPGGVNGTVRALEIAGNTVYAGGDFSQPNGDGPYSSTIDLSTGATDAPGVKANANVMCSAPDGAGGWYIGGQFTLVGGVARGRAARINADGTLHPWDPNVAGGDVRAIRVIGSEVYLGGNFLTVGGQVRGGMAAVDATTGALLPFFDNMAISPISTSSYILDFEQNGNDLIAGGQFSFLGGAKQYGVKLDATSSAPDFGYLVPNGIVYAAASDGAGGWYIGGAFTSVGGTTRNRLARINADGTLNAWNPNSNNTVYSLAFSGGNVYAGGVFTSVGGQTRRLIAALDGTTGLVTAF
ncbi:MAG: delta-60 repeat domain-containing protein, partial [Flavobacteriales bacterium]|nr:delta-60 repeat domain-containing protein [Flavobacteriales bacterium]